MKQQQLVKEAEYYTIGKRLPRTDSWAKVVGKAQYADDIEPARMVYGRLLRSPHPHAKILRVDTSKAEQLPGVVAVLVGSELPTKWGIMPTTLDEYPLAVDRVCYVGDALAAVAALDEETAERG
ncbi:MAG: aldehyde oxidase, partial [Chloroflexota bacterium]|nr:aldehyde oxidase [Chloroflexota bacterium]